MLGFDGRLSRYFGPDSPANSMAMSAPDAQTSDLYFKGVVDSHVVEDLVAQQAPLGPRDEVRELVHGYVAGFNRYLGEDPDVECAGADWVRPMTEMDVYRRVYAVTTLMDQTAMFSSGIAASEPPVASQEALGQSDSQQAHAFAHDPFSGKSRPGSNGIALGGDITKSGGGINVANPHLKWTLDMRWAVGQLTIPGELDVAGASLIGVPLVVMGHTSSVSWSITMAQRARHHTLFELTLADDSPTTYIIDGKREEMQSRHVTIDVKRPDGSIEQVTRTQWYTKLGPVLGAGTVLELPPWSAASEAGPGRAFVVADVNARNMRMLNTLFAFNHAKTSSDVLDAIRQTQGVPWWSVLAADAQGQALFSQIQVVPNVPDDMLERCSTDLGRAYFAGGRYAILDGSRSDCGFQTDSDAIEPGIMGPGSDTAPRMPFTLTRDYAENSNDSHWVPSAGARISGMPSLLGDEGTERDLRTRGIITEIEQQKARAPYTRQILADAVLSNRSFSADLVLDESVALCRNLPQGKALSTEGASVDVQAACDVLEGFDHHMNIDSAGSLLFSRFWVRASRSSKAAEVSLWKVAFDPADPVNTPRTLDPSNPWIASALADTVQEFEADGIPLTAPIGDYQFVVRDGHRIPIGGGTDELAVINLIEASSEPNAEPDNGSGYMHVVSFDGGACPDAVTLLSYSQSSDALSPHHADQTELFSQQRWVTERFCESAIQASPELQVLKLSPPTEK